MGGTEVPVVLLRHWLQRPIGNSEAVSLCRDAEYFHPPSVFELLFS